MAKKLSDFSVGTLVKDITTKYYGVPIVWKITDKNHRGYPANSVTFISDKILTLKCFDAMEPRNSDSNRRLKGNNRYIYSNIRQWLNSTASMGTWYTAQHTADAPPNSSNVLRNNNEYEAEEGFLKGFSANMVSALLATTITAGKANVDGGGTETCSDKIFLASCTEMGCSGDHTCGVPFPIFNSNTERQAYPTTECVSESEYTDSGFNTSSPRYYWLCDAYAPYSYGVRIVTSAGTLGSNNAYYSHGGIRPLCNLPSTTLVSDTPDTDGAYTILWNRPPQKPSTITVPKNIYINKATNISWSSTTDPDGDKLSYVLERKINSENWIQIYSGDSTNFDDTVTQKSANTAQYRVKAVDSFNNSSDYAVSQSATIIHNVPPKISGTDEDLGVKNNNDFEYKYNVSDAEGGKVTVVEKVDETEIKSYTANLGQENVLQISSKDWLSLTNGKHVIKVIATDIDGGVSAREITFTKQVNELFVMLKNPLSSAYRPSRIKVTVEAQVPADGQMRIYACNNGNDESPTWEDISMFVKSNFAYVFTNKIKTSAQWGVNIKVVISRKNTEEDCYITKVEGNFE